MGSNWTTIIASTPNTNSFSWTLPIVVSANGLVRVSDAAVSAINDASDTVFAIVLAAVSGTDRAALIDLYNATNGDSWTNNTGWKTAPLHTDGFALPGTENTWFGVTTDGTNTNVLNVSLPGNNLVGTLPASLGNLTNLQELILYSNQLSGSIPASFGSLSNLVTLNLSGNQLSGSVPAELGNLNNLQYCVLFNNPLSGSIPPELGNLSQLKELWIYHNQLTGAIPTQLGNLGNLLKLGLYDSQLSGTIPSSLGNLSNLQELWLYKNQLTGSIPAQLGNLGNLLKLGLYENQLTGAIPPELGNLTNLTELWAFTNLLSGTIPAQLANLVSVIKLDFYGNQLTGSLPPGLATLGNVQHFDFGLNQLSGSIPAEYGNFNNVIYLGLDQNQLTGGIPAELASLGTLQQLRLGSNQLSGSIPAELGSLTNLTYLGLYTNQLTGTIPPELANLTQLYYLGLQANQLTGGIPMELGNLANLEYLVLRSNQLTGGIPMELGNLSKLKWLILHSNQLSGEIPPQIGNLTNLTDLDLHSNKLSGSIPTSLTGLTSLTSTTTNIGYNAFYSADAGLTAFLDAKDADWAVTQTIAPTGVSAAPGDASAEVTWTPIPYTGDTGGYRVFYATTAGGPYTFYAQTADKAATSQVVSGLTNGTPYYFVVQTRTDVHAGNLNAVDSGNSDEATATPTLVTTGTLTLTAPNGGENWLLGSTHGILWTSTGTVGNVKIEYSTDNGASWRTIVSSRANTGGYSWTSGSPTDPTLNTLSTTCLVRISGVAGEAVPDTSDGNFAISASAAITGTITDLAGTPLPNAYAQAFDLNNVRIVTRLANASGEYWMAGLPAGSYKLVFFADSTQNNLYEWYDDQRTFNAAAPIAVTLNNTTANINAQLAAGGIISGRVTDETGAPLAEVVIAAWTEDGLSGYWVAESDGNGDYQVKGLPAGNIKLMFELTGYPAKFNGNGYSFEQSTPVSVTLGAETSGINMVLEKGGHISGTIIDGAGNPVSGIRVLTYDATSHDYLRPPGNVAFTAADGTYSIQVRAGQTHVLFDASAKPESGLRSQFYSNQTTFAAAGSVDVIKEGTTPNINATLAAGGGTLTVQVTNGLGQGVVASVYLYNTETGTETRMRPGAATDANGYLEIKGLIPGNYKVKVYDSNDQLGRYHTEWYDNALTYAGAAPVNVTEGGTTAIAVVMGETAPVAPEINLKQGATDIATGGTYDFGSKTVGTDTDTVFTIENLGTDSLILSGLPLSITGTNADQFAITVQPTSPVANGGTKTFTVGFHPTSPGAKTAQMSIANNDGNENPYVLNLTGTGGDAAGTLTVTSPNGGESWILGSTHNVTWTSTGTVGNVKIEYSTDNGASWMTIVASTPNDGAISWTSGSLTDPALNTVSTTCLVKISGVAGEALPDQSDAVFTIAASGFIHGTVTDSLGAPIPDVRVCAYDLNNVYISRGWTNAAGEYGIGGMVAGSYKILFDPTATTGNYLIEWYNNQPSFNAGGSVAVTLNNVIEGINAQLNPGGMVSGRVMAEGGAPLEGVAVTAWMENGFYGLWYAETDANGDYRVQGLPAGNVRLMYSLSGYPQKFYGNVYTLETGTNVPVTIGTETTGINMVLEKGGTISGTVTDGGGNPVSGIRIIPYDAASHDYLRPTGTVLTGANGTYSVLVRAGQTKVLFDASPNPGSGLRSQYYNNQTTFAAAGSVNVVKDGTTPNINAVLAAGGGTITVQVTNSLGQGVPAAVYLYDPVTETRVTIGTATDAGGYVEFKGLIPGNYKVKIYDSNGEWGRYYDEWYNNALTHAMASQVNVTEGGTTALSVVLSESAPVAPEINLKQGTTDIATGGTHGFGSRIVGTDTDAVFTIENLGTDSLTLSGLPLSITGTNADQFAIAVQPTSPVAAAGTKTFTVRFHPTSVGAKAAQISIANNDSNENPYVLNLTGTGADAAATLTVTSPNGGQSWIEGTVHNITWTTTGTVANVKLQYSTNNGGNWTTIVSSTANTGTYAWIVPSTLSVNCLVLISGAPSGIPTDASNAVFAIIAGTPTLALSKTAFNFGSEQYGTPTAAETCVVSNSGTGVINWTATPSAAWLGVTPVSGTGAGTLTISILDTSLSPGNYAGTITVADPGAINSPLAITVNYQVYDNGADAPPFGAFETPADGATVASSIPVTGWVLDDIGMVGVKIYRGTDASDREFVGDAILVRGARKDVEAAYPGYPQNEVAGWGYMLLTNFLPNGGNGTFTLLAYATDTGGHEVLLGSKTITCDNENAVLPFGAIDTPTQGGTASGSAFMNFGWALTPRPNSIPLDGSTLLVWVDGSPLSHPSYNHYRGDIATLFPGYVNSNGAVGLYFLNTTAYTDGVHTIAWSVQDSAGHVDGIGSRYFSIQNAVGGSSAGATGLLVLFESAGKMSETVAGMREDGRNPVYVKQGMAADARVEMVLPDADGAIRIAIPEVTRAAIYLKEAEAGETQSEMIARGARMLSKAASADSVSGTHYEAYELALGELKPLPIGASFDPVDGVLYWQPGPGFLGEYTFVIIDRETGTKRNISVTIKSR